MRITLCESLARTFAEISFDEYSNIDRYIALAAQYENNAANREFAQLRCAAKLVADEFELYRPDYSELAKIRHSFDPRRWLENALLAPNPSRSEARILIDRVTFKSFIEDNWKVALSRNLSVASQHSDVEVAGERLVNAIAKPLLDQSAGVVISSDPLLNRAYLEVERKLSSENILAYLAMAGIRTTLPRVFIDQGGGWDINYGLEDEVIGQLRSKFEEERKAYISCLRKVIKDCYEGLKAGLYEDVYDYADKATNQELMVQVQGFESAMKKADKKLLERVKVGLIKGIPSIADAAIDPKKGFLTQTGIEILKVLSASFADHNAFKEACEKFPVASYAYKLRATAAKRAL